MTPSEFFKTFGKAAVIACLPYPLFPSVLLAQAVLESNWNKSSLSSKYNNFFGIKSASTWGNKSVDLKTGEVFNGKAVEITDGFEVYSDPYFSFLDRNRILQISRYKTAGVLSASTVEEQCKAIKTGGWATDPAYPQKLMQIINKYNLHHFDSLKADCDSILKAAV